MIRFKKIIKKLNVALKETNFNPKYGIVDLARKIEISKENF
ncbi:MAG: hypothetical protein SPK36_01715 [Bacilli bacterium]|nr:hypothetical protein [Bacilli bacterium]